MRFTHVRLLVEDYGACFRFYRDVLGFKPTFGDEEGPYADFDAGSDTSLALFESRYQLAARPGNSGDDAVLIFAVDDVDQAVERLGVALEHQPEDKSEWGIRVAYIRDPDGNLIELNQPLPA